MLYDAIIDFGGTTRNAPAHGSCIFRDIILEETFLGLERLLAETFMADSLKGGNLTDSLIEKFLS